MTNSFEQKKYTDIIRYGKEGTEGIFLVGDEIIVQEKIDGSNASIVRYKGTTDLHKYSRYTELTGEGGLNGFVRWANSNVDAMQLVPGLVYYGEWVAKRKVKYPEHNQKFFLFDIYDLDKEEYLPFDFVKSEATRLAFNLVPVLYRGAFISDEHLKSLVGKTLLGGQVGGDTKGEGIVVKGNRLNKFGRRQFVKLVINGFSEVKHVSKEERLERKRQIESTPERLFVVDTVTEARIDKIVYKLQDEGALPAVLSLKDMGEILKYTSQKTFEDIMKEESDLLPKEYDKKLITKGISVVLPPIVKKIVASR